MNPNPRTTTNRYANNGLSMAVMPVTTIWGMVRPCACRYFFSASKIKLGHNPAQTTKTKHDGDETRHTPSPLQTVATPGMNPST